MLQLLSIIQTTKPLYMLTIAVNAHIEPLNGFKNIHALSVKYDFPGTTMTRPEAV